ncbi:hypothetical protein IC235_21315 [Hymenobacter sp. BT664]|uniref:T9SS type A sorting domain-containing protein n=1 Tax=Hymenobacter montanus TaxID=2771359 RepID=A0A927BI25_9BACT|nr:hypothetical protein [Hymenobacter montanus]MBD2770433.1 hypothetical protein [Hymenobacter montanus]
MAHGAKEDTLGHRSQRHRSGGSPADLLTEVEPIRSLRALPLPKELRLAARPAPQAVLAPYEREGSGALTDFQGQGPAFTPAGSWTIMGGQARTGTSTYQPNERAELVSAPVLLDTALTDRAYALMGFMLYFDERYALETGHDVGAVYLQHERPDQSWSPWSLLSQRTGQRPGPGLRTTYLSLRDPALWQRRVRVKFVLESDCAAQYEGWTIDNVVFRQIVTTPQIRTAFVPGLPMAPIGPNTGGLPRVRPGDLLHPPINGLQRWLVPALERLQQHPCRLDVTFVVNGAYIMYNSIVQDLPRLVNNNLDQLAELLQGARQSSCKRVRFVVAGGRQDPLPDGTRFNYAVFGAGGEGSNAHANLVLTNLTDLKEKVLAKVARNWDQNTIRPQNGALLLKTYLDTYYGATPEPGVKRVIVVLNNSDEFDNFDFSHGPVVTAPQLRAQLAAQGVTLLVNTHPQLANRYGLGVLQQAAAVTYQDADPQHMLLDLAAAAACTPQDEPCNDEDEAVRLVSVDFQGPDNHPMQKQAVRKEDPWQDDAYADAGNLKIDYPEWQAAEQEGPPAVNDPVAQTWQTPAVMEVQLRVGRTAAKAGTLAVYRDGAVVASKTVSLQPGLNTIADWTWDQHVADVTGEQQVNLTWRFTPDGADQQFVGASSHTFFIMLDKLALTGDDKYVGRTAKRMQFVAQAIADICCNRQNAQEPGVDEDGLSITYYTVTPKKEAVFKVFEYFETRNINFDPLCAPCLSNKIPWDILDGLNNGSGDCGSLADLMQVTLGMGGVEARHKYLFATTKNDFSFYKDAKEGCVADLIEKRDFVIDGQTKTLQLMYKNGGDPNINIKESVTVAEGFLIAPGVGIWDDPVDVLTNFICPNTVESGNYQVWVENQGNNIGTVQEIPGHYPEPFPFDCSAITSYTYKGQGKVKRKTKTKTAAASASRAGTSAAVTGTRAANQAAAAAPLEVYPNPFQDEFSLSYELPQADGVSVLLVPLTGGQATSLLTGKQQAAGRQQLTLRSGGVAPGLYLLIVRGRRGFELRQKLVKLP